MIPRVRIGDLVDHDWRHYEFSRNSGLPRGTFDERSDRWGDRFVLAVMAVAALCFFLGLIQ